MTTTKTPKEFINPAQAKCLEFYGSGDFEHMLEINNEAEFKRIALAFLSTVPSAPKRLQMSARTKPMALHTPARAAGASAWSVRVTFMLYKRKGYPLSSS